LTVKVSKETVDSTDVNKKIAMEEENESDADQSFASSKKDSDSSVSNEEDIPAAAARSSKKKSSGGQTTDSYQEHSLVLSTEIAILLFPLLFLMLRSARTLGLTCIIIA
jgi:L-fucose isomerase-like protein